MDDESLTKLERSLLNKRACRLGGELFEAFRKRLTEGAVRIKRDGTLLDATAIDAIAADIRDECIDLMMGDVP